MTDSKVYKSVGFGRSDKKTFTIPNGATGALVTRLDLGRPYAFFVVRIQNTTNIQAATTLKIKVANDDDGQTMCDLFEMNDPSVQWSKTITKTGTMQFAISHAFGSRYIQFILSQNTSGGSVAIDVYGYDPTPVDTIGGA